MSMGAASVNGFHGHGDAVTDSALGDDDARLGRILLDLATQPQNLHVDGTVVDFVVVAAAEHNQLLARHHPVGSGKKRREQVELTVAESDLRASVPGQSAGSQVQLPARDPVSAAHWRAVPLPP